MSDNKSAGKHNSGSGNGSGSDSDGASYGDGLRRSARKKVMSALAAEATAHNTDVMSLIQSISKRRGSMVTGPTTSAPAAAITQQGGDDTDTGQGGPPTAPSAAVDHKLSGVMNAMQMGSGPKHGGGGARGIGANTIAGRKEKKQPAAAAGVNVSIGNDQQHSSDTDNGNEQLPTVRHHRRHHRRRHRHRSHSTDSSGSSSDECYDVDYYNVPVPTLYYRGHRIKARDQWWVQMQHRVYYSYDSFRQWCGENKCSSTRNRNEQEALCSIIDALNANHIGLAKELVCRRLVGVTHADEYGDWSYANALNLDRPKELANTYLQRQVNKDATRLRTASNAAAATATAAPSSSSSSRRGGKSGGHGGGKGGKTGTGNDNGRGSNTKSATPKEK